MSQLHRRKIREIGTNSEMVRDVQFAELLLAEINLTSSFLPESRLDCFVINLVDYGSPSQI